MVHQTNDVPVQAQQPPSEKGMLTTVMGAIWNAESICNPGAFLPEDDKVIDLENERSTWGQTMMGSLPTRAAACAFDDHGKSSRDAVIANYYPGNCLPEDDDVIDQLNKQSTGERIATLGCAQPFLDNIVGVVGSVSFGTIRECAFNSN